MPPVKEGMVKVSLPLGSHWNSGCMEPWNLVLVYPHSIVVDIVNAGPRCRSFWIHVVKRGCGAEGAVEAVNLLPRDLLPDIGHPGAGEADRAGTRVLAMAARGSELSLANTLWLATHL